MPIGLDPNAGVWYSLKVDEKIQEANRPAFRIRFLTARKLTEASQKFEEAAKIANSTPIMEAETLFPVVASGVIGWKNFPSAFTRSEFEKLWNEVLTSSEQWELARACIERPQIEERDRKNSASQPPSVTVAAAENATIAKTLPPNPTPCTSTESVVPTVTETPQSGIPAQPVGVVGG